MEKPRPFASAARDRRFVRLLWRAARAGTAVFVASLRGAEPAPAVVAVDGGAAGRTTLTTVREVRQLSPEEAARGHPVKLRGVITYRAKGQPFRFLQDETGGTYFSSPYTSAGAEELMEPGFVVEVEGFTAPGQFVPFVGRGPWPAVRWRKIGQGPLPAPRRVSIGELADPQFHSDYIELSGVVRQVRRRRLDHAGTEVVWIKIGSHAASFTAQYFDPAGLARLPEHFIGSRVTVRGVYGSTFNDQRQLIGFRLFVDPDIGLEVQEPGPANALTDLPVTPVSALMQFRGEARESPMVRIVGTVTQLVPGRGFYVESQERGVWVESEESFAELQPGQRLSVAGFPAFGAWNPILKDGFFQREGVASLASPPVITVDEAFSGRFDCRRVTIEGALLEVVTSGETPSAVLQLDGRTVLVEWIAAEAAAGLRALQPGSIVRVTGTGLNRRLESSWAGGESGPFTALVTPRQVGFRLLVATAADLTVVQAPGWWTPQRIWTALGVVAVLAGAILAWNVSLRRRVRTQTEIIRSQATREAVHEDRTRIARELHDTLEQELTGIAVQLDAVSDRLPESPPAAAAALGTARALLQHTRTEARRSVWDLRATLLEEGDLGAALREIAHQLEGGPAIQVVVDGPVRRLPAPVENNLLRIGTEAMTNAVKHAAARRIEVRLNFGAGEVTLDVSDDGRGFDASRSTTLAAGHFGWLGIRERAERIGANLTLQSTPGTGTRVAVRVPIGSLPEAESPSRSPAKNGDSDIQPRETTG